MIRSTICLLLAAVSACAGFKEVVQSGEHFLFLKDDGTVLGFGECRFGQLAKAPCTFERRPIPIALPGKAKDIAVAKWTSFAVLEDGSVYSWGSDEEYALGRSGGLKRGAREGTMPGRVPGLPPAVQVVASSESAGVLTAEGEVWMWGSLGAQISQVPMRIEGLPPIASIAMGPGTTPAGIHMLAIGRDGSLWGWGRNSYGQAGDGTREDISVPKKVPIPPVASVAGGGNNSVAVLVDGTVRAWGRNDSSTMGNGKNVQDEGTLVPTPVPGVTGAASVVAGYGHIIVLLKNGTIRTWGHDGWGQAGIGTSGGYQMRPAAPKLTGVTAVFAPRNQCYALTSDGRFWFWGPGHYKLPGFMETDKKVPVDITALW